MPKAKKPNHKVLFAVKIGGHGPDARTTLAQAIENWGLVEEEAVDLARFLIDELKVGNSAQERGVYYNSVIRAGNRVGIPMLHELRKMHKSAKAKAKETDHPVAKGRARGLAQAIAFVQSPDTWLKSTDRDRLKMIKRVETE